MGYCRTSSCACISSDHIIECDSYVYIRMYRDDVKRKLYITVVLVLDGTPFRSIANLNEFLDGDYDHMHRGYY